MLERRRRGSSRDLAKFAVDFGRVGVIEFAPTLELLLGSMEFGLLFTIVKVVQ